VRLAHGGGGRLARQLIEDVFLPVFGNRYLNVLDDSARLELSESELAFTTDSFVVDPIFFPGGDIGRLAVCGTVNDLSVVGAKPLYLSIGFIIEEGFPIQQLKRIALSIRKTADEADVLIVTGDTKVVEHGSADGVFINTSGIGILRSHVEISGTKARIGDRIIVNGPLGNHGMAIVTSRQNLGFKSQIQSDVAPLNHLTERMFEASDRIHAMRDATRGGLVTVLNEIAHSSKISIELNEEEIPVSEEVQGACEILGFDPLYVANEGVLVACVHPADAELLVKRMKNTPYGKKSKIIGRVIESSKGRVTLRTKIGSHRILDMLSGEQLPRIC
jgi:hydrogenase expression/formation protein HypE